MLGGSDKWLLGEQKSVDLVVHSMLVIVIRSSHSLLGHLALVHVTRRLVVVAEWDGRCDDGQDVEAVEFLVSRVRSDILFQSCNR